MSSLETAAEILEVSEDPTSLLGREERQTELILFSVSPGYINLRKKLGIRADAG